MLYQELMLHIATHQETMIIFSCTHYIPKLQIYIQLWLTSMKTDKKIALDNSTHIFFYYYR